MGGFEAHLAIVGKCTHTRVGLASNTVGALQYPHFITSLRPCHLPILRTLRDYLDAILQTYTMKTKADSDPLKSIQS